MNAPHLQVPILPEIRPPQTCVERARAMLNFRLPVSRSLLASVQSLRVEIEFEALSTGRITEDIAEALHILDVNAARAASEGLAETPMRVGDPAALTPTGRNNGLCQDYSAGLSRWFAGRVDARHVCRQAFTRTEADLALWDAAMRCTRDGELFDRTLTAKRDDNGEALFCDTHSMYRAGQFYREKLRIEAERLGVTVEVLRRECVRFEHSDEWRRWLHENIG